MISALLLGLSYGFAAGVSPGPMLGLVITQTLRRGWRAGNLVALAPLFSDLPIILLAGLLLSRLPPELFGWLRVAGGLFVIYLGIETIVSAARLGAHDPLAAPELAPAGGPTAEAPTVLWRAVLTNWLNPHPYLFWGTVGAQLIAQSYAGAGAAGAVVLLVSFYTLLVGSKLLIALLVHRSRAWLRGGAYRAVLIGSGVLLCGLGVLLLFERNV
ncbi:MAG: LysE family translocator [Roseiflexaceae bacterium]